MSRNYVHRSVSRFSRCPRKFSIQTPFEVKLLEGADGRSPPKTHYLPCAPVTFIHQAGIDLFQCPGENLVTDLPGEFLYTFFKFIKV